MLPYEKVKDWGQLEWIRPALDVVFDGTADAVDIQLKALMGDGYMRFQTPLDHASDDLDAATPENLAALELEARELIAERRRGSRRVVRATQRGMRQKNALPGVSLTLGSVLARASACAGVSHAPSLADGAAWRSKR